MPTELERENLHNLDVGDDYHLQGDAKWETERKRVERERLQASAKIRSAAMQFWTNKPYRKACAPLARAACRFGSRLGTRAKRWCPSERRSVDSSR